MHPELQIRRGSHGLRWILAMNCRISLGSVTIHACNTLLVADLMGFTRREERERLCPCLQSLCSNFPPLYGHSMEKTWQECLERQPTANLRNQPWILLERFLMAFTSCQRPESDVHQLINCSRNTLWVFFHCLVL